MENIQKYLALWIAEAVYTIPVYNGRFFIEGNTGKGKKLSLFTRSKRRTRQIKKADTTRWFHNLTNAHLLALWVLGIFYPIPASHTSIYHFVCLAAGWFFYYTMDRFVSQALTIGEQNAVSGYVPEAGLYGLAGYNRQTRLILLLGLTLAVAATFITHITFALLVGFVLRWLIESQLLVLVVPTKMLDSSLKMVKE